MYKRRDITNIPWILACIVITNGLKAMNIGCTADQDKLKDHADGHGGSTTLSSRLTFSLNISFLIAFVVGQRYWRVGAGKEIPINGNLPWSTPHAWAPSWYTGTPSHTHTNAKSVLQSTATINCISQNTFKYDPVGVTMRGGKWTENMQRSSRRSPFIQDHR